jgi:hypothetical protein
MPVSTNEFLQPKSIYLNIQQYIIVQLMNNSTSAVTSKKSESEISHSHSNKQEEEDIITITEIGDIVSYIIVVVVT